MGDPPTQPKTRPRRTRRRAYKPEPKEDVWAANVTRKERPKSASAVDLKPQLNAQKMRDYGYGIPRWSPYAPTGYRVSKGTGNQDYGEYTKHDYLKRLSDLLAEHGRKSGADLKMLPTQA